MRWNFLPAAPLLVVTYMGSQNIKGHTLLHKPLPVANIVTLQRHGAVVNAIIILAQNSDSCMSYMMSTDRLTLSRRAMDLMLTRG
jgi:hypothetical protein